MNKLFEPIQIGSMTLKNRIVMAPMGTTTDTTNAFNMRLRSCADRRCCRLY